MVSDCVPKVSIIVPVYNVGLYAVDCLHSLLNQDYKNLEIIVVDDGSTDDTASICSQVVADDCRAMILHKDNGGLSSARNFGLASASGDYLMYVDGDDVLERRAVSQLVGLAQKTGAPLVTCQYKKIRSAHDIGESENGSSRVVSGDELLEMMLRLNGESGSAWGKLYSIELATLLAFPMGQLFEDFGVEATIFAHIDKACVSDSELYGYMTREDSITTVKKYGDKHMEGMEASLAVVRNLVAAKPELQDAFLCFEAFCSLRVAARLDLSRCSDKGRAASYIAEARKRCRAAASSSLASKTWRARCALFAASPALHNFAYIFYGKLTGKVIG